MGLFGGVYTNEFQVSLPFLLAARVFRCVWMTNCFVLCKIRTLIRLAPPQSIWLTSCPNAGYQLLITPYHCCCWYYYKICVDYFLQAVLYTTENFPDILYPGDYSRTHTHNTNTPIHSYTYTRTKSQVWNTMFLPQRCSSAHSSCL